MAILQTDNPLFNTVVTQYYADMTALADMAYAGDIDEFEYRQEQERMTTAVLLALFLLAGGNQGTPAGAQFLEEQQAMIRDSTQALAGDLFDGRYSASENKTAEAARGSLLSRLELWTFNMGAAFYIGLITAVTALAAEPSYQWVLGRTEKHCSTCLEQNGQVRTRSEWAIWAADGVHPQGRGLECGGWRCDCSLVEVR
jgi:hypothetical protein